MRRKDGKIKWRDKWTMLCTHLSSKYLWRGLYTSHSWLFVYLTSIDKWTEHRIPDSYFKVSMQSLLKPPLLRLHYTPKCIVESIYGPALYHVLANPVARKNTKRYVHMYGWLAGWETKYRIPKILKLAVASQNASIQFGNTIIFICLKQHRYMYRMQQMHMF